MFHNKLIFSKYFLEKKYKNIFVVISEDVVTDLPEVVNGKNDYQGAARQSFGSGSLRPGDTTPYNKIHRDKQEQLTNRLSNNRDNSGDYGIMVIHQAPQSPIANAFKPAPYTPVLRSPSKNSPMHVPIIHDPIRSQFGVRREDSTYLGGLGKHEKILIPEHEVLHDVDEILEGHHMNSGTTAHECDLKCGSTEFYCSKSCSCIHSDLHCDGQIGK